MMYPASPHAPHAIGEGLSIANLIGSIGARFGAASPLAPLACEPATHALHQSRCVVLLLMDGVGCAQLERLPAGAALRTSRLTDLSSVFPSSTAPAITTLASGLPPSQHAITGWYTWSPEHQAVARPLPMDLRGDHAHALDPNTFLGWQALSARMNVPVTVMQPAAIADSAYSRFAWAGARRQHYVRLHDLQGHLLEAARHGARHGGFIYAYLPQFDSVAHEFGWTSGRARQVLVAFDRFFESLAQQLSSTEVLLLASADHGFIDVPSDQLLQIEAFPDVAQHLMHPLSGEPRVVFCHVNETRREAFEAAARAQLGFAFDLYPSDALLNAGWFGPCTDTGRIRDRIGTHCLVARDHYCLTQTLPGEKPVSFIGMHGGIRPEEMRVPLLATRSGRIPSSH